MMEWNTNNAVKFLKDMEPKSMMEMVSMDPTVITMGAPEKPNTTTPVVKVRKKTMTSLYLKFFETAPDGKTRSCKFCKQSYSIATATGNLGRHLSHRHPGYDKTGDVTPNGISNQQTITITKKQPLQPQTKPASVDLDHLNWLLLKWLISSSQPLETLQNEGLSNSFKFANPLINIWPIERFQGVVYEVFRSMREDVKTCLDQVRSKISITLDFWTSYEQVCYMSVTSHWIDENWAIHKVLLDISHISSSGGSDIYHMLLKVLKMYNIEKRILCCTHDNSQNALSACHTLSKEDMDGRKTGSLCYIPCAARTLNLIIEDGLRPAKQVISKIREFALLLNTSLEITNDFKQITSAYQESSSWKYPLDTSIRWSGNYTMLEIIRRASKSVDAVIRKHEETLGNRNLVLNPVERNAVSNVHAYLEPFYKTTNNICSSKFPTVGLVLFFMDHVVEMISACKDSRHNPEWLKATAEEMAKKARSYNSQVYNVFIYIAAILDPRIKGELVPENLNTDTNLEDARSYFLRNYSSSGSGSSCQFYEDDRGGVSFAEEIARKRRRVNTSSSGDELTQYLAEPPANFTTDVLEWWKGNAGRYPRLAVMARDFLAVQAVSVVAEELFCKEGDEVDKRRMCLPHGSMQAVLCTRAWVESGFKLRYRSTEIDFERLMESACGPSENGAVISEDKK